MRKAGRERTGFREGEGEVKDFKDFKDLKDLRGVRVLGEWGCGISF